MYRVLLLQCSTHSLRAAFCSLWLSMSKICFCAPKHSLRNRSPSVSALVLVAEDDNQLDSGLLVKTKNCAYGPFEVGFAMSNNSDFFRFFIISTS